MAGVTVRDMNRRERIGRDESARQLTIQQGKTVRCRRGTRRIGVCLCLCFLLLMGLPGGALQLRNMRSLGGVAAAADDAENGNGSGVRETVVEDPTKPGEGYSAVLYNNSNGLPTSEANDIVQSQDGYLWIGSYSGLIRYDGNSFTRFESPSGITSVVSLFVDSRDRLWIGTNDGGAAMMYRGEIKTFRKQEGLQSLTIRGFAEGGNGNIYIATSRGIAEINEDLQVRMLGQAVGQTQIRDKSIRCLTQDEDGRVYGLTTGNELFVLEDGKLVCFIDWSETEFKERFVSISPDTYNPGYFYLGTETDILYHMNLRNGVGAYRKIVTPCSYINDAVPGPDQLWICADNGIAVMEKGQFRLLDKVPMNNSVEHLLVDYQGNLWFTSSRAGVMKIVPNPFADILAWYSDEPRKMVVNSTCIYGTRLLLGTDEGLIVLNDTKEITQMDIYETSRSDGVKIHESNLVSMLEDVRIRSVICDSKSRLWISTYNSPYGLIRYDHGSVTCFTNKDLTAEKLPSNQIRTVYECRDGTVLAACHGGLAVIRDGKEVVKVYDEDDGIVNTEILTVTESPAGEYIIGTDGGGIFIIKGENTPQKRNTDSGLSSDIVMRIKKDEKRGVYWIVTSNSLSYMQMNEKYEVTRIRNFPYSNNFDLYENSHGEMWILSSNGIYIERADTLLANGAIEPEFYDFANGLPCLASPNSYSALTDYGVLYMAGSTGVVRVNIDAPREKVDNLRMSVPYVTVDGVDVYPDEDGVIRISSKAKRVIVHPEVFTYSLSNPYTAYRLDGFEKDFTTVRRKDLTPVAYTNIPGGSYRFVLKIHDSVDMLGREYSIRIVKAKALYERLWFRMLMFAVLAALLCLLVYLYVKRKTRKLIAKQKEQKMFIDEVTEAFAKVIDMKDRYTNGHSTRVAQYTVMLAKELGCDEETVDKYHNIALLHDIGKIGVPAAVLNKQGKLTDEEFKIIKSHSSLGYRALKDISVMPELAVGAAAHHERPDGKGYPRGLKQEEIPRVAQIIAVADTFDAMYSDRPYRGRMNFDKTVSVIRNAAGTQLTADVVDAFLRLVDRGFFRAPDDTGGGTTEDIDNIHKQQKNNAPAEPPQESAPEREEAPKPEESERKSPSGKGKPGRKKRQ